MNDLKNELQAFDSEEYDESHKKKAIDALKRMENWNLFSDTYEVCYFIFSILEMSDILCSRNRDPDNWCISSMLSCVISLEAIYYSDHTLAMQEFQNYTVARDTFLSHLGATLWGSLRHIISPSLADGAFHYYEKISFQLVFVTQEVKTHGKRAFFRESVKFCIHSCLFF